MSDVCSVSEPRFTAFVAIDWADRSPVYAFEDAATGRRQTGAFEHTPAAVEAWVGELLRGRGGPLAVAIEQSRGALPAMLAQRQELLIYPVPTVTVARRRQAFFPSGAKDDPPDALLLLDLLTHQRDRLRPLEPDTVETRTLQFLVEQRRQIVRCERWRSSGFGSCFAVGRAASPTTKRATSTRWSGAAPLCSLHSSPTVEIL